jgi:hypothetical protein
MSRYARAWWRPVRRTKGLRRIGSSPGINVSLAPSNRTAWKGMWEDMAMSRPASAMPGDGVAPPDARLEQAPPISGPAGPANRVLDELQFALTNEPAEEEQWSFAASGRFILAVCGAFWLLIALGYYALH